MPKTTRVSQILTEQRKESQKLVTATEILDGLRSEENKTEDKRDPHWEAMKAVVTGPGKKFDVEAPLSDEEVIKIIRQFSTIIRNPGLPCNKWPSIPEMLSFTVLFYAIIKEDYKTFESAVRYYFPYSITVLKFKYSATLNGISIESNLLSWAIARRQKSIAAVIFRACEKIGDHNASFINSDGTPEQLKFCPFSMAANAGFYELAYFMAKSRNGGKIATFRYPSGRTPLHWAVFLKNKFLFDAIFAHYKGDQHKTLRDNSGKTPESMAASYEYARLAFQARDQQTQ